MTKERPWKTGEFEYDGFPLYLRVQDGLNYNELEKDYPQFISVTHNLSSVKNNGLPESDYNKSLIDFDGYLIGILEHSANGITVLVETFGGKRTYYMYSRSDVDVSSIEQEIEQLYPEHQLEIESSNDNDWSFIRKYANDWNF